MEDIFLSFSRQSYPAAVEISLTFGKDICALAAYLHISTELFTGSRRSLNFYGSSQEFV